ncbi:MAG: hypothetical protein ACLQDY_19650 [Streptosporangiaceae bacterium]
MHGNSLLLLAFVAVCLMLALLLVAQVVSIVASSLVFAVALVAFGLLTARSRGRASHR